MKQSAFLSNTVWFFAFLKRILKAYDGCCKSLREFAHLSEISNKQTNVGSFVVKHTNYFLKYFIASIESDQNRFISRHSIMKYQMKEKMTKILSKDYVRFVTYYGPLS